MIKKLDETATLKDSKGKEYKFEMYSYDTIDDIDDAVKNYKQAGLYMFAKRYIKNGATMFKLSYIGETGDYSTRGYSNHHKTLEQMNLVCICIVEQMQKDLNLKETLLIQMILLVMGEIRTSIDF